MAASLRPRCVRSRISSRGNSTNPPSTISIERPAGRVGRDIPERGEGGSRLGGLASRMLSKSRRAVG